MQSCNNAAATEVVEIKAVSIRWVAMEVHRCWKSSGDGSAEAMAVQCSGDGGAVAMTVQYSDVGSARLWQRQCDGANGDDAATMAAMRVTMSWYQCQCHRRLWWWQA